VFRLAEDFAKEGLFKYRAFASEQDRDRVKRTIKYGEIYFSSRVELTHPFELQMAFRLQSDKKTVIKGILQGAQRAARRSGAKAKAIMKMNGLLRRADPAATMRFVEEQHNKRMAAEASFTAYVQTRTIRFSGRTMPTVTRGYALDSTAPFTLSWELARSIIRTTIQSPYFTN
jgi:hypothetical protein